MSKENTASKICTCCGKTGFFYKSYSILYAKDERIPICKDCLLSLYATYVNRLNNEEMAIYKMCERLDIYFDISLLQTAIEQANKKNSNKMAIYLQKVNSLKQHAGNTFENSDSIESDDLKKDEDGRDVDLFWGSELSEKDYQFLEAEFEKLALQHGCEKYSEEVLYKEICLTMLDIRKTRESNGSVDKKVDTLQKLMDSANIKPSSSTSKGEKVDTYGLWIREVENSDPCEVFEKKPVYADFDGFKEYMDKWMLRPLRNLLIGTRDFEFIKEIENRVDVDIPTGDADEN